MMIPILILVVAAAAVVLGNTPDLNLNVITLMHKKLVVAY
jgi:hypothetical protein